MVINMEFKSIYKHRPSPAIISSDSEVKRDESLTISQIISLHLRGIPANVHMYDEVEYERGLNDYSDENLTEDAYELENDLSDFNLFVDSSGDNHIPEVRSNADTNDTKRGDFFENQQVNVSSGAVPSEPILENANNKA